MPAIFSKNTKIKVIEYGENCHSFPLLKNIKAKIKNRIKLFCNYDKNRAKTPEDKK